MSVAEASAETGMGEGAAPPPEWVVVDLDGTLVRTDLFAEAAIRYAAREPLGLLRLLGWLRRGRAHAKTRVAEAVPLDPGHLPYNDWLLARLRAWKEAGARLVLATGAPRRYAEAVAEHLGIFDAILATTEKENLTGRRKLEAIRNLTGGAPFVYAGNGRADVPVWREAAGAVFVDTPPRVRRRVAATEVHGELTTPGGGLAALVRLGRPRHWVKNLLVFVPLLLSHGYGDLTLLGRVVATFLLFSLAASGVYALNDVVDAGADRRHPTKRRRPVASGAVPPSMAVGVAVLAEAAAVAGAYLAVGPDVAFVLLGYVVLTTSYSLWLKRHSSIDVIVLAALYTVRLIAGGAAAEVELSAWLLGFSLFFFVSLAYLKRHAELVRIGDGGAHDVAPGRRYGKADRSVTLVLGVANMTAAIVVLALYIHSVTAVSTYGTPEWLWLIVVIMLYWGNRIWTGAARGKVDDDPIAFAIRDGVTWVLAGVAVGAVLLARYW